MASDLMRKAHEKISAVLTKISSTLTSMSIEIQNNILVFNKIDKDFEDEKIKYLKKKYPESMFVSAKDYIRINMLIDKIDKIIKKEYIVEDLVLSYDKLRLVNHIYSRLQVISRQDSYENIKLRVSGSSDLIDKIKQKINGKH